MSARTESSEKAILARAEAREGEIDKRLGQLRPVVLTDAAAYDEYRLLTLERARVANVISLAHWNLHNG